MDPHLIIFETHPIQYRAPIWQELQKLIPDRFEVVYATDCSVRGHSDAGFGQMIAWDNSLLQGYNYRVLNNERGAPLTTWRSLHGRGVHDILSRKKPAFVLMSSFGYEFNMTVYLWCLKFNIPLWIRMETQDEAFERSVTKDALRFLIYRILYTYVDRAFCIGELNRQHLLRHGIKDAKIQYARYCTQDRFADLTYEDKLARREHVREALGISKQDKVIGFFGKLIPKKDPMLLIDALETIPSSVRKDIVFLFVGSGELQRELEARCASLQCKVFFTGFVDQKNLPGYYLATDVAALPSRRAGETWGLVVNEALQAGCCAIVSDAVGCYREFGNWPRVRVIPPGSHIMLAKAICQLAPLDRDFDWAQEPLKQYSVQAAANAIASAVDGYDSHRTSAV